MRLLKKTIVSYFIFSATLLIITIPAFYYVLKAMMVNNVDETLLATKIRIMPQLRNAVVNHNEGNLIFSGFDIVFQKEHFNKTGDSIYTTEMSGSYPGELLTSRLLASHFIINRESYRLQIRTFMADKFTFIKRIVLVLAILLLVLLLGLIMINRMLTKEIWRPFYNTLNRLHDYRVDKQSPLKLEPSSVTEFNDLNKTVEQLAERDYQAFANQKEFTENASHEMQSPLAVFQSKLELLMQTKPLNEDQASLITDLANMTKRMSRLNKSLILLTKIENNQFLDKETMSVKDILQKLVQQYEFQIRLQSIHCIFKDENDIIIDTNKTLMEILLRNLLSNAIRHNVQNGSILIMLKENELIIQNSGKSSSIDAQKLFQRFQKESTDANSIGLGLEIVKKICALNHYQIQYQFINRMHTFSVLFLG
jgi:signal transduction histidine kinase